MSKVEELPKYGNYIDGAIVPPASNEYLPTENPYSGKVWALIGRGNERRRRRRRRRRRSAR